MLGRKLIITTISALAIVCPQVMKAVDDALSGFASGSMVDGLEYCKENHNSPVLWAGMNATVGCAIA